MTRNKLFTVNPGWRILLTDLGIRPANVLRLAGLPDDAFDCTSKYPDYFQFTEQFSNSAYSSLVNKQDIEKFYEPMIKILNKGIQQKILKDISFEILSVFMFYPVMLLSNPIPGGRQLNCKDIPALMIH